MARRLINIGHMTEQLTQLHHTHAHTPPSFGRAFAVGIGLNMAFVLIEAGYGLISNSVALLADAGHNISDVLGLIIAWWAATLAKRPPSERYTYGWRGGTILAALANEPDVDWRRMT